jgi:hypothetical protein
MGIFSSIMDKLRHHAGGGAQQAAPQTTQQGAPAQQQQFQPANSQQSSSAGGQAPLQNVDVGAVLEQLAQKKGGGGNYRESIVDLLKLLDLDSSLDARKNLAAELDVHEGQSGTAEQNIALHKAVMRKLAENGGKVPDSLRH